MHAHKFVVVALVGLLALARGTAQSRQIQVGFCTPLANIDAARAAGFDYVELATSEIAGLSDAAFEQAAAHHPAVRHFRRRPRTCFCRRP